MLARSERRTAEDANTAPQGSRIRLAPPRLLRRDEPGSPVRVELRFPLQVEAAPRFPADSLYFRIEEQFADFVSHSSDAALLALLIPAMERGCALTVEGDVTASLLKRCQGEIQTLIMRVVPGLTRVPITCTGTLLPDAQPAGDAVITGLSCGVDSLFTVDELLFDPAVPPADRLTHFVLNNVGGSGELQNPKAAEQYRLHSLHAARAADKLALPLIRVSSNMDLFYKKDFQQTHTLRNVSVAHFLSGRARALHYSSTVAYEDVRAEKNKDISVVDPILLPLLSTSRLRAFSSGASLRRVDKTRQIATLPIAQSDLNICVNMEDDVQNFRCTEIDGTLRISHRNCGYCWKCARTLVALETMGRVAPFSDVFILENYASVKRYFIAHAWARRKHDELNRELFELMDEEGFALDRRQRIANRMFSAAYALVYLLPLPALRLVMNRPHALNGGWTNERLWRSVVKLLVWSKRFTPKTMTTSHGSPKLREEPRS